MAAPSADAAEKTKSPYVGQLVEDFALSDIHGQSCKLSDFSDKRLVVVAFLGTECPLAKLYGRRLTELASKYADRGVAFLGINANAQDSLAELTAYGRTHEIEFPLLKDVGNRVSDAMGATRTPEVFLLDQARTVCYHGQIDDQYNVGESRPGAGEHYLRKAIEACLEGKPIEISTTKPIGCLIGRAKRASDESNVTYAREVSRLLDKHCVECHRPGAIGPFALTNYDDAAGWADMLAEVVRDQRMPPWHANPRYGHFANARGMTDEEKQLLYDWAEHGAPQGDLSDLPKPRKFTEGWRLSREPDQVVAMAEKPYQVQAEGLVDYQYFAVDPGFTEDKYISAAEVIPGDPSVVHHVIVYVSSPRDSRTRGTGWLTSYVPGHEVMEFEPGRARLVAAGSKFVFQMHYTPNGKATEDISKVGIIFADPETVTEEVVSVAAAQPMFEIPPGASSHRVDAFIRWFPKGGKLLSLSPHMHVRGKEFRFAAVYPDGRREMLLDVPRFDFNWQHSYLLAEPLEIPDDFVVHCIARFDNSEENLSNPDPTAKVRWGDQTMEEMMIGFFDVAIPKGEWQRQMSEKIPNARERARATRLADGIAADFVDRAERRRSR
ncbi:MAG: redoxin domain-containing protein [Pirellulales bacterium]